MKKGIDAFPHFHITIIEHSVHSRKPREQCQESARK